MTTTTDRSELLEQPSEGIANLATSDEWQRYLDCQSRFYSYSSNNIMIRPGFSGDFSASLHHAALT